MLQYIVSKAKDNKATAPRQTRQRQCTRRHAMPGTQLMNAPSLLTSRQTHATRTQFLPRLLRTQHPGSSYCRDTTLDTHQLRSLCHTVNNQQSQLPPRYNKTVHIQSSHYRCMQCVLGIFITLAGSDGEYCEVQLPLCFKVNIRCFYYVPENDNYSSSVAHTRFQTASYQSVTIIENIRRTGAG